MSTTTPEPITKATVKVNTGDFRQLLKSVHAHHTTSKKEAFRGQHRVRLTFANSLMFIGACNDKTTALAKLGYVEDSRGTLWAATDAPLVVDLQPRHVPLLAAWASSKAVASDVDQLLAITVDVETGEIEFEDIGGLWSQGERVTYAFDPPHESFPDLIAITAKALDEVAGEGERQKALVQDGGILKLFSVASTQIKAPVRIRATGGAEGRGFVVQCGPSFFGTVSSAHGDDDGLKTRERIDTEWRRVLGARLVAVG